jgi:hypothetical protein
MTKTNWSRETSSLFQDSEETNPSKEKIYASFESFFEPEQQRSGIFMGAPRPPPVKVVIYFFSEAVEAK